MDTEPGSQVASTDVLTSNQLYDNDFVTWAEQQGLALRRGGESGSNLPIDWDNVGREIEALGRREHNDIETLVHHILFYLLKIASSPNAKMRNAWMDEVDELRDQIGRLLKRNSSIKAAFPLLVDAEWPCVLGRVERQLHRYGEYDTALPALLAWKRYRMKADDVLRDGAYPARGVATWTQDA